MPQQVKLDSYNMSLDDLIKSNSNISKFYNEGEDDDENKAREERRIGDDSFGLGD
jgi:hypothetical protein